MATVSGAHGSARGAGAVRRSRPEELVLARRGELQRQLDVLDSQLAMLREARGDEVADDEHDPEGPTLSAEWSRVEGQREDVAAELRALADALARVEAGTYGVCVSCGRPIPAARLEVRPGADRCVPCASR
jgi:DnaK suppressor protein